MPKKITNQERVAHRYQHQRWQGQPNGYALGCRAGKARGISSIFGKSVTIKQNER